MEREFDADAEYDRYTNDDHGQDGAPLVAPTTALDAETEAKPLPW